MKYKKLFLNRSAAGKALLSIVLLSATALNTRAQLFQQENLRLVSRQFSFTEGPAANAEGDVYFTDQPDNAIWKYSTGGTLSLYMRPAGRANGMYFDPKGNLLVCADENNELWKLSAAGHKKVLIRDTGGKKLNGPNDVWADAKGGIYLTDPYYQRDYWVRQTTELSGQYVYYLAPGKNSRLKAVATDLGKPNGIAGSADGRYLYIADIERNKTYRYTIQPNGELKEQTVVIEQGSDGMTLDSQGNFYLTGKGVSIYNAAGQSIGHIDITEPWTSNVCFGGKDRSELFITASAAIYVLPMNVKGIK